MNITNTQPVFSLESFGLGEDGQVADQAKFCAGLQALTDHPLKAIHEPQLVERVFTTIDKADLSEWPEVKKVQGLVKEVFEKWVKVSLGDSVRHIPRQRLKSDCGPKFMQQYEHRLADTRSHELHLALPENVSSEDYPAKLTESFLAHLQTGVVSEDAFDENILNLIDLALQHFQEALVKECVDFLVENLDGDNLDNIFTFAIDRNILQLKWACYRFLQENQADIPMELQNKYHNQLDLVKSLQEKHIELRSSPSGQTELYIEALHNETLPLLKRISDEIPVHSIVMSDPILDISISFLEKIAPRFPGLQELIICNAKPTVQDIPTLKKLFPKLTAFGNDAPFLKTFEEVETYLQSFAKPGASESESETIALRSLNLKSIKTLDDSQMDQLKEHLQGVYHLVINSQKITSVTVPNATTIECKSCTTVERLIAPNALYISCNGCKALTTLRAPKATSISCNGCKALTTLRAPKATSISCFNCTALTTLAAPNATWIDCDMCPALRTLIAPGVTTLNCAQCTALTTVTAPKATTINCMWCSALETLTAPETKTIYCSGCRALETFHTPKAKEIDCRWCTALTALNAPNATTIDCDECNALTTLTAPNAATIDCDGCNALTTLTAPKATLTGEYRIRIWARWFRNQIRTFLNSGLIFYQWAANLLNKLIKNLFRR